MTNTVEVPIELIKAGDINAIQGLLSKQSLFGRWATHPDYRRGIIINDNATEEGNVIFSYKNRRFTGGSNWEIVSLDDLIVLPAELTTLEDFKGAHIGTIVAQSGGIAYQKVYPERNWESRSGTLTNEEMANSGPWTILRWGKGE